MEPHPHSTVFGESYTSPPACHSIVAQNMHVKGAASMSVSEISWKRGKIYKMERLRTTTKSPPACHSIAAITFRFELFVVLVACDYGFT